MDGGWRAGKEYHEWSGERFCQGEATGGDVDEIASRWLEFGGWID
jgi:hypothetical protein